MDTSSDLPPLPKKMTHNVFTEIVPRLTPEMSLEDLAKLDAIVAKTGVVESYQSLADGLRKMQMVKLNGLKAVALETEFAKLREPIVTAVTGKAVRSDKEIYR